MLNANNLLVAKVATKEVSRYTLKAIRVTPDYTEATDGHQAVRVTTPKHFASCADFPEVPGLQATDDHQPFLMDSEEALQVVKMLGGKRSNLPVLECVAVGHETNVNGHAHLGFFANKDLDKPRNLMSKKPEGQFPQIDLAIPKDTEEPLHTLLINPEMLGNLLLLLGRMSGNPRQGVEVKFYKRDDSCLVAFETENADTGQKATGVVMGMRPNKRK